MNIWVGNTGGSVSSSRIASIHLMIILVKGPLIKGFPSGSGGRQPIRIGLSLLSPRVS